MKRLYFSFYLLTYSFSGPLIASEQIATRVLLQDMSRTSQVSNYEINYVNISKEGVNSVRYRHAVFDGQPVAQLLQMDGPRREILQSGNKISYFEPGLEPFTLSGSHIVDALPSIVFSDFARLEQYYDYVSVGVSRVAGRASKVIRVVARDDTRYSYIVWIDEATKLLLRVDLLDRDGKTLEQFRVISITTGNQVKNLMRAAVKADLLPVLVTPASEIADFGWSMGWLPEGIAEVSRSRRNLVNFSFPIESRLCTDGLFSFSVNVNPVGKMRSAVQTFRQGRRTVYIEVRNGSEITVVGELPPASAKRIADSIVFKTQR